MGIVVQCDLNAVQRHHHVARQSFHGQGVFRKETEGGAGVGVGQHPRADGVHDARNAHRTAHTAAADQVDVLQYCVSW